MEEDNENPSLINSHVKSALITNIVYLNKKRKFQEDQLELPLSKHKCFERILSFECDSLLNQGPENEDFQTCMLYEDIEKGMSDDGSGHDSAKDSNSFVTDSDSAMSAYGEAKSEPDFAKTSMYDRPSTSSGQHPHDENSKFQEYHNLEEHLLEFEDLIDYSCSEYGNDSIKQCKDKDLEDIPYFSGMNPNTYVLSSGRWTLNREAQLGTRKPTIDQEFEQYFSSLMLH